MNILIITVPLREKPSNNIPVGPLSIMKYMRNHGVDGVELYDIDVFRPAFDEAVKNIIDKKPDVLGISGVVSTAYEYTKNLSFAIKEALPNCLIVLGGNMAASAEIALRRTKVDICVNGDGEIPFLEICQRAMETRDPFKYMDIKGLVYLGDDGALVNTGYGDTVPVDEMWDYDLADLEKSIGTLDRHIPLALSGYDSDIWFRDANVEISSKHRMGNLFVAKGCVAKCTFCHRWSKGLRHVPVSHLKKRLENLIKNHDVGALNIAAESFGNDKRWLVEFLEMIKPYNLAWRAHGVRSNTFDKEWLVRMSDAGCTGVGFGNETGSAEMLEIMEKKVSLEDNYNSMKWSIEAGMQVGVQLVIGMPGESPKTIKETIKYCQYVTSLTPEQDPNNMSINYAQALPGTPLYEYGRSKGIIGQDIDGEEAYLIRISDRNAHDETTTINFTTYPTLMSRTWRPQITIETNYHFVKKFGLDHYLNGLLSSDSVKGEAIKAKAASGYYANPKRLLEQGVGDDGQLGSEDKVTTPNLFKLVLKGRFGAAMLWHPVVFYRLRRFLPLFILIKAMKNEGTAKTLELFSEYVRFKLKSIFMSNHFDHDFKSLRKIVEVDIGALPGDNEAMAPLRRGR